MTPQYHSHECRRFIFGRKRYRNLHESPKRTTTPASRDESEIEPEIKGFRLSVGHRHTAIRSTAPRDLHAAGPPRNPPYGEIPAPAAIPARPAPEQYPATSCAEKLRPDETKIPKTTTNRMKIFIYFCLNASLNGEATRPLPTKTEPDGNLDHRLYDLRSQDAARFYAP